LDNSKNENMRQVVIQPDPKRLIEGLRDTGYSFDTAIADIVDNSIMAEANNIEISVNQDPTGEIVVMIIDNGIGMNEQELQNAIKYGSNKQSNPKSLSKFGLGLKTGSTAFCRRLSVISKRSETSLERATWDLDNVIDEWVVELDSGTADEAALIKTISQNDSGTIIRWNKVDRFIKEYDHPTGRHAQKAINKKIDDLVDHLAKVFQRFINHEDSRGRNIEILVNGIKVEHWDPFCEWHTETHVVEKTQEVTMDDGVVSFKVRSFIIPRKQEYNSAENFKKAKILTNNQGVYVYRENRMICGPDWLGIYSREPHFNLLRVEFSFNNDMDEAFYVDIKKSKISLEAELYKWLENFLIPERRAARDRYDKGIRAAISSQSNEVHADSNRGIASMEASVKTTSSEIDPTSPNTVNVTNRSGTFKIHMPVNEPLKEGQLVVQTVDTIDDGLLWQPCQINHDGNSHHGVEINTGHPYYQKVYVPNRKSGVTVQGMDSLLWALCEAERSIINPEISRQLKTLRFEVSKVLRDLVEDLPEPKIDDEE
jgi:hypothetical protein